MAFICFYLFQVLLFQAANVELFICVYNTDAIVVDGNLEDWRDARQITLYDESLKTANKAIVRTMWSDTDLYISFQVFDTDLRAIQTTLDHPELYLDDMVEFLLDIRNDKDSCWSSDDVIYHINLLGQKKDDRGTDDCVTNPKWNGTAEYAIILAGSLNNAGDTDSGYVVEISIPWTELEVMPRQGLHLGANFATGDGGKLFDWVDASPFRSPYAFGDLILFKR